MDSYQRRPADVARGGGPLGASETINDADCLSSAADPVSRIRGAVALFRCCRCLRSRAEYLRIHLPMPCPASSASRRRRSCRRPRRSWMTRWRRACSRLSARPRPGHMDNRTRATRVLRQMHDLVNNVAAIWPSLQNPQTPLSGAPQAAAGNADGLAEVRPRTTVRPGQRATISMTLRNSESHSVRLVPVATDLLGSRGGRIASSLLACAPSELTLEPQEQRDMAITTTVPAGTAPGCYSGLLVVMGLDYLRALITIEVV